MTVPSGMHAAASADNAAALDEAHARLITRFGRILGAAWVPALALGIWQSRVTDVEGTRAMVVQLAVAMVGTMALWRPWRGRVPLQAGIALALLAIGITSAVFVTGLQAGAVAGSALGVVLATVFFGTRGLVGMTLLIALIYTGAGVQSALWHESAIVLYPTNGWGYWLRFGVMALTGCALAGVAVLEALTAYGVARSRERMIIEEQVAEIASRTSETAASEARVQRAVSHRFAAQLSDEGMAMAAALASQGDLLRPLTTGNEERRALDALLGAASRLRRVATDLRAISESAGHGNHFDAGTSLRRVEAILRGVLPAKVACRAEVEPGCELAGDEVQFELVLMVVIAQLREFVSAGNTVTLRLARAADAEARLTVEAAIPPSSGAAFARLFAPLHPLPTDASVLPARLAAVARVLREAGARLECRDGDTTGVLVQLYWPRAKTTAPGRR